MRKLRKFFCYVAYIFGVCICSSGCGNQKDQGITFKQKDDVSSERSVPTAAPLIGVDGGTQEYLTILDAKDIRQEEKGKWYTDEINKIVHNAPGYEEAYSDLLSFVNIAISSQDFDLYQQKECYVSQKPILYWGAERSCIDEGQVDLFIFSKDLEKTALYSVCYEGGKYLTGSIMNTSSDPRWSILYNKRNTKYIFIINGWRQLLLNPKNKLFNDDKPYIQVKGDYYHKLDYKNMAVSYQELTDKKNLVKLDLD